MVPFSTLGEGGPLRYVTYLAADLPAGHYFTAAAGLTIWDSVVLAGAAEAECRLLLSERLQDGSRGGESP